MRDLVTPPQRDLANLTLQLLPLLGYLCTLVFISDLELVTLNPPPRDLVTPLPHDLVTLTLQLLPLLSYLCTLADSVFSSYMTLKS